MAEDFHFDESSHYKNLLYDFYGELLTQKQRACFEMHYMEDLSLAEIGERQEVTPQAVADLLKRTVSILTGYEAVLGLVQKHTEQASASHEIHQILNLFSDNGYTEQIAAIRRLVKTMML